LFFVRLLPVLFRLVAGIGEYSHKKKAAFWRALVALFPHLIDFLCSCVAGRVCSPCFFPFSGGSFLRPAPALAPLPFVAAPARRPFVCVAPLAAAHAFLHAFRATQREGARPAAARARPRPLLPRVHLVARRPAGHRGPAGLYSRVLTGYSWGTYGVLTGYPTGTHGVLGYSRGTYGVLMGYSWGAHRVRISRARAAPRGLAARRPSQTRPHGVRTSARARTKKETQKALQVAHAKVNTELFSWVREEYRGQV
jgi:hypothetical protein